MSRVCYASIPRRRVLVAALAWGAGAATVLAQDTVRLVLKGHDPVAYFTLGAPTKGDPRYGHEWDGGRYLFVSAEHREMFIADPERYAPQFGGFCTGFMSRGIRSEGDPGGWVIHEDRLYVFGQARFREVARSDPAFLPSRLEGARKNWQVLRTGQ